LSAEVLRILTACDLASRKHYPTTLFAPEEAYVGACTAKTTIYCANIAAGLMLSQFAKWLRRLPVEPDLRLNLLTGEGCMTVVAVPDWPMKEGRTCRGPWEEGLERPLRRMGHGGRAIGRQAC
jgi:hypothetical protein